jgi:hypothetical protein
VPRGVFSPIPHGPPTAFSHMREPRTSGAPSPVRRNHLHCSAQGGSLARRWPRQLVHITTIRNRDCRWRDPRRRHLIRVSPAMEIAPSRSPVRSRGVTISFTWTNKFARGRPPEQRFSPKHPLPTSRRTIVGLLSERAAPPGNGASLCDLARSSHHSAYCHAPANRHPAPWPFRRAAT